MSSEVLKQMRIPVKGNEIPVITANQLVEADGLLFGFPTRYGFMAAQMKAFFDSTAELWQEQKLAGMPAEFFVSTGTQGGGQETTRICSMDSKYRGSSRVGRMIQGMPVGLCQQIPSSVKSWTAITQLAHHGMIYVPIGYTFGARMFMMDSLRGGTPYGAGVFSGDGTREPREIELALAEHQGQYMASTVKRFARPLPYAPLKM